MKVDFEEKTIEIEIGDTFKKLKELVEKHKLENFKLSPAQYNNKTYVQLPYPDSINIPDNSGNVNPYTYPTIFFQTNKQ